MSLLTVHRKKANKRVLDKSKRSRVWGNVDIYFVANNNKLRVLIRCFKSCIVSNNLYARTKSDDVAILIGRSESTEKLELFKLFYYILEDISIGAVTIYAENDSFNIDDSLKFVSWYEIIGQVGECWIDGPVKALFFS
ncbi:hypothetical protein EDEG_00920 [Edhazardia aedis USNM 41457]|uniref:Uncharacterized protein n=1 Tax=Edhazardia aedis (strain USNM 41457) TaxID=1003232 RepID=J9DQU8_EDHAE|nr:hypothetical protein EDEG_00920 [Edhazardia aedis USNM 41457]|eukprot:EJW04945.1 hypothetical protein EDEG_00920 [Edhazardia aedis USNM 41457]